MTSEDFANLIAGRRAGPDRWIAKCPAHPDKTPSLGIREGQDGRVLVHCFAGCTVLEILAAQGLWVRDLFPGPPPSAAQARTLAAARGRRDDEERALHRKHGEQADRIRKLACLVDALGGNLARLSDDAPDNDAVTWLFHHAVSQLRNAEMALKAVHGPR